MQLAGRGSPVRLPTLVALFFVPWPCEIQAVALKLAWLSTCPQAQRFMLHLTIPIYAKKILVYDQFFHTFKMNTYMFFLLLVFNSAFLIVIFNSIEIYTWKDLLSEAEILVFLFTQNIINCFLVIL